jgi:hypothetical protein
VRQGAGFQPLMPQIEAVCWQLAIATALKIQGATKEESQVLVLEPWTHLEQTAGCHFTAR